MELRYHSCGHPVRVHGVPHHGHASPTFFDGSAAWSDAPISTCPRCGQQLTAEALHDQPQGPAVTLVAWQAAWPALRRQIEALIAKQVERDPHFYAYHAEMAIQEFAGALQTIAEMTVQLEAQTSTPSAAARAADR